MKIDRNSKGQFIKGGNNGMLGNKFMKNCYYNKGVKTEDCPYYRNFLSL